MKEIALIVLGSVLALLSAWVVEFIKQRREENNKLKYGNALLNILVKEMFEGIERCKMLKELTLSGQLSFSRIHTAMWDSVRGNLPDYFKNPEMMGLIHKIYYRFDLVNFNLNSGRIGPGQAFAKDYYNEMKLNLNRILNIYDERLSAMGTKGYFNFLKNCAKQIHS